MKTNEMMFLQPIMKYDGFYIYVCDNIVGFIDRSGQYLQQYTCDFPLKEGYSDGIHAADDQCCIWSCSEYSSITAGGRTYIQKFDEILELRGSKLTQVCSIPGLSPTNEANFRLKLFQINNVLHFVNGEYVFKFEDSSTFPLTEFSYENIISFCGHNVVYDDVMNKVFRLNDDLSVDLICELDRSISVFCFAQGGVLIVSDEDDKKFFFIDVVNYKFIRKAFSKKSKFAQEQISESLVYAPCGLSLSDQDLEQIFDKQFVLQRNALFEQFRNQQIQQEGFPHEEVNKLMRSAVGSCTIDHFDWDSQINSRMTFIQRQLQKQNKLQKQQKEMKLEIENTISGSRREAEAIKAIKQDVAQLQKENFELKQKNQELEQKMELMLKAINKITGINMLNEVEEK